MASSASGGALARKRASGSALSVPRVGDLRPYLFLALLTALVLTAAYAVRPTVRIDMGGDYDAAFLRDFNGREIDAADGVFETHAWAPGQETLSVPGARSGDWIAILRAAPGQPEGILDEAAVAVNDVRVDMPRRTAETVLAKIPPQLAAAPALRFSLVSPLVGGALPPRDIVAQVELAPARTYRWTTGESRVVLPNLGRGAWVAELGLVTQHPDGQPLAASLQAGAMPPVELPESASPRRVRLLVPPAAMRDGSLELTIRSNTFEDPRPLGVLLAEVVVAPAAGAGPAAAVPPLGGLGLALVTALGAFATLQIAAGGWARRPGGRLPASFWPALGVALAILAGGWALMAHRFPSSFMLPRLAALALWSILLVLAARPLTRWLFRTGGAPLEADERPTTKDQRPAAAASMAQPEMSGGARHSSVVHRPSSPAIGGQAFLAGLLLIFIVGFWLKAVGAIFPYFVAIDVHWHMTRASWILNVDGALSQLYGTNSPLNETTMPTAEWGENRPVIPYSPWFHIIATGFAFVPFLSMDMAANLTSILFDSTRVILIALIAARCGLNRRAALIAAATFAVLPVGFLLHSWGNLPTAFGLWLTLVCNTVILCWWERLGERRVMIALSVLLLLTFLIYTVTGVFMGVFLVVFTVLAWLNSRRGGDWGTLTRSLRPLWIAAGVAIALALAIYYGQYISPIVAQTVPYMSTVFTQGPESVGVERPPFGQYMWSFVPHLDYRIWPGDYLYYGLAIPLLFTIPGFFALRGRPVPWVVFAAWGSVALLFMLAGYRISMVDKQLFYLLPVICVCWAVYAERIWARWAWGRWLVVAVLLYSLYAALDQWVLRIATSPVVG